MNAPLRAFLKTLYGTVFPLFYRKIDISGLEGIPPKVPIMLCANHSNAFLDPLLIGVPFPRHVWYLARGDVFGSPFINRILHALGILPIYRQQEGVDNLEKNTAVFETCYRFLGRGGVIGIFPEGNAERESHLRPLKKGAARILLGAVKSGHVQEELYVVPAGINYEFPDYFQSRLHIRYGRPLPVSSFLQDAEVLSPKNVNRLSKAIHQAMTEVHIHIEDKHTQRAFFFMINQFDKIFKTEGLTGDAYFLSLQKFAAHWNKKTGSEDVGLKHFLFFEQTVHGIHKQHRILSSVMLRSMLGYGSVHKFPSNLVLPFVLLLGLPGLIFNIIPFRVPYLLSKKIVKKAEFFNSVNVVSAGLVFLIWYLFFYLASGWCFEPAWFRLSLLSVLFFSGFMALRLHHLFRKFQSAFRWRAFCRSQPLRAAELREMASDALLWVKHFADDAGGFKKSP